MINNEVRDGHQFLKMMCAAAEFQKKFRPGSAIEYDLESMQDLVQPYRHAPLFVLNILARKKAKGERI